MGLLLDHKKRPLLSIAHDVHEDRATSQLTACDDVESLVAHLSMVSQWGNKACDLDFSASRGAKEQLQHWIDFVVWELKRYSPDTAVSQLPNKIQASLHEIASWCVQLESVSRENSPKAPFIASISKAAHWL